MQAYLRSAVKEDMDLLYQWANDPAVRANSFTVSEIKYEEHQKWFLELLEDSLCRQYIYVYNGEDIGQIRLTFAGDKAEIGYSIQTDKRCMGHGNEMIRLIKQKVKDEFPYVSKLIAKVKPSNAASIYCFENNQFEEKFQQYEYAMKNYKQYSEEGCNDEADTEDGGGGKNSLPDEQQKYPSVV